MAFTLDDLEGSRLPAPVAQEAKTATGFTLDDLEEPTTKKAAGKTDPYASVRQQGGDYATVVEKKHGLPAGLLVSIRDNGERSGSQAVSPKGATGRYQFMPDTAKEMGLTDPTNDVLSTEAAGRYSRKLYEQYKAKFPKATESQLWSAVIAHYNGGTVQANLAASGKELSFKETRDYLNRVRAGVPSISGGFTLDDLQGSDENYDETSRLAKRPVVGTPSTTAPAPRRALAGTAGQISANTLLPLTPEQKAAGVPSAASTENEPDFMEPGSRSSALAQGASNAVTLGLSHYAAPAITATQNRLTGKSTADSWRSEYQKELEKERELLAINRATRPGYTLAGDIAGGLVLPVGAAAAAARTTLLGRAAVLGGVGAAQGATRGALERNLDKDSTAGDVLESGFVGAGIGGALGAGFPLAGAAARYAGRKADTFATGTQLGKDFLQKHGDLNTVTGKTMQTSVGQLLGDLSGASSFTAEGRRRLVDAQLAKEYERSTPLIVNRIKDRDPETGRVVSIDKVEPRFDENGRLIFDNVYREYKGPDSKGRAIYGDPVTDMSKIPPKRLGREVTDSKGKPIGYVDDAIVMPDVMPGEVPAIRGPVADAMTLGKGLGSHKPGSDRRVNALYGIRGQTNPNLGISPANAEKSLTPEELAKWEVDLSPDLTKVGRDLRLREAEMELQNILKERSAKGVLTPPDEVARLREDITKKALQIGAADMGKIQSAMARQEPAAQSAAAKALSEQAAAQAKATVIRGFIDGVSTAGVFGLEMLGLPPDARNAALLGLFLRRGGALTKEVQTLALKSAPDLIKAYNFRVAAGDTKGAAMIAGKIGEKLISTALKGVDPKRIQAYARTIQAESERSNKDAAEKKRLLGEDSPVLGSVGEDPYQMLGSPGKTDPYASMR